jgi:hypothetical protein
LQTISGRHQNEKRSTLSGYERAVGGLKALENRHELAHERLGEATTDETHALQTARLIVEAEHEGAEVATAVAGAKRIATDDELA